ncbi:MAG: EAL domain-containing protein [Solirubrobacteraceae bacterium]
MDDLPDRPITVLVAGDDDREDTKQLLRELSSAGYQLRWVGSAEEAADAPYAIVSTRALSELAVLRHDALHDALTGLPNRALFLDRLELSVRRARRQTEEFCCAVLFLDLDRFKLVNDSLGHLVGDRLLMAVAKRLEAALRPGDTVARHGGDEFTLLLDDIGDVHGASVVAERLQESLSAPFEVGNRELHVSASIGLALVAPDRAPEDVVRDADVAMYRAKAQGGARHAVFDQAMHARVMARLELETGLRRALERDELRVLYQPVIETATGRISGFEALSRWTDRSGQAIAPREFVAIADETGLILPLGRFVLAQACRRLAVWRAHPYGKTLSISVNVTGRQLAHPGFVQLVTDALYEARLDPRGLRLEVAESAMMEDPEATRRVLARLFDEHSVSARIDDFGLGASSLRQLHRFPGDAVKLDRSFVVPMLEDQAAFDIVKAIIALAHNLGMEVIAEGVETQEHLDRLKLLGCEYAQGFYIAGALDAGAATALLDRGTADTLG